MTIFPKKKQKSTQLHQPVIFQDGNISASDLKVLVCYHKPSVLPPLNSCFVPIHVGRALNNAYSKDGQINNTDQEWLLSHMIGDNTGQNISTENRKYCELTAIYWAWKNYRALGNPDYIGLSHYRRLFNLNKVNLDFADIFVAEKWISDKNAYEQFITAHGNEDLDKAIQIIKEEYPSYNLAMETYLNQHQLHMFNMFIMKKELFFHYAEWLFNILHKLDKKLDYTNRTHQSLRVLGYIAERLLGIFVFKQIEEGLKIGEIPLVQPTENELNIFIFPKQTISNALVLTIECDDSSVFNTGVLLQSFITNQPINKNFEVFILDNGLSESNRQLLLQTEQKNLHLNFIKTQQAIDTYCKENALNCDDLDAKNIIPFLIPWIFKYFKQVLYLNSKIIVNKDISFLFEQYNQYGLFIYTSVLHHPTTPDKWFIDWIEKSIKQEKFSVPILMYDISHLSKWNFTQQCLNCIDSKIILKENFLNKNLLDLIQIMPIDLVIETALFEKNGFLLKNLDFKTHDILIKNTSNPTFIYFNSTAKPSKSPFTPFGSFFWKYARTTPFYEGFLLQSVQKQASLTKNIKKLLLTTYTGKKIIYLTYKLFSLCSWGDAKQKFKTRRFELKKDLKKSKRVIR